MTTDLPEKERWGLNYEHIIGLWRFLSLTS